MYYTREYLNRAHREIDTIFRVLFPEHGMAVREEQIMLCHEMLDAPLTGIGKMMGDRDHTTVMHGIEKIEKEMSAKDSVRNTVDILKKKINPSK